MATVKLILDKDRTFFKKTGEANYTSKLAKLTVDGINFTSDGRGDICKLSFVEAVKWSTPEDDKVLDTFSDWVASFSNYEDNLETLESLSRGNSINVMLQLSEGDKGWFQNIKYIETIKDTNETPSVHKEIPHTTQKVDIPIEEPEEKQSTPSVHKEDIEDKSLPPEAEFRFAIPYHDRRNLSIQRQKSIEFALQFLDNLAKHKLEPDGQINYTQFIEVSDFIWHGIQELWKDIPRTIENGESSKK